MKKMQGDPDPIATLMSKLMAGKPSPTNDTGGLLLNELKNPSSRPSPNEDMSYNSVPSGGMQPGQPLDLLQTLLAGRPESFYGTSLFADNMISDSEDENNQQVDEEVAGERAESLEDAGDPISMFRKLKLNGEKLKEVHQKNIVNASVLAVDECPLFGLNVNEINLDECIGLEEHTVASMRRDFGFYQGKLVASNGIFIAYVSKNGVRLIQQSDGHYTLLKDHSSPVVDVALSPISLSNTSKLVSVGANGQVIIQEIDNDPEDRIEARTVFEIQAPTTSEFLIKRCIFSFDASRVLLVAQNALFEVNLAALNYEPSRITYSDLKECPFIRSHADKMTSITCADFFGNSNDFVTGFADGTLQTFSQRSPENQIFMFQDWQKPVTSISGVGSDSNLIIIGYEKNRRLFLLDTQTCEKKQELVFDCESVEAFVNYLFHGPSSSLYVSASTSPSLIRFELVDGLFELRETFSLPDIALSINAEPKTVDDLELFVVFEKSISIFTFPVALTSSAKEEMDKQDLRREIIANILADVAEQNEFIANAMVEAAEEREAEQYVSDEISNRIINEAVQNVTNEIAADSFAEKKKEEIKESFEQRQPLNCGTVKFLQPVNRESLEFKLPPGLELELLIDTILEKKLANSQLPVSEQVDRLIEKQLNDKITTQMDTIVGLHLQAFSENLDTNLPQVIHSVVDGIFKNQIGQLEAVVQKSVATHVSKAISEHKFTDKLSAAVSDKISKNMAELMSSNFESVLIPAYQAATQVMFKQMQTAFQQGLNTVMQDFKQNISKSYGDGSSGKSEALKQLTKSSERQMKMLEDLSKKITKLETTTQQAALASSSASLPVSKKKKDIKEEIKEYLVKGEFENAFTKALESSNLDVLLFLLQTVSPSEVFVMGGHPVVSQPVLLSLIQQLSFNLSDSTELKFSWIQECLASLDPKHALIAEYAKQILSSVIVKLEEWAQMINRETPNNPLLITAKLLIRLAGSLCMI